MRLRCLLSKRTFLSGAFQTPSSNFNRPFTRDYFHVIVPYSKSLSLSRSSEFLCPRTFRKHFSPFLRFQSSMRPFGVLQDWSFKLTPEEFESQLNQLIERCKKLHDVVVNVPDAEVSLKSVLKVMNDVEIEMKSNGYFYDSAHYFAVDDGIRKVSAEADKKLREFTVETRMREDLFQKLLILHKKKEPLKAEAQRFLDKLISYGKRNGLHLDEATQNKIKEKLKKSSNLTVNFAQNLNDVTTTLEFSDEELNGMTKDYVGNLKRNPDTGKAEVTLKYPHFFPIMEKCKVPETRKKMEFAFNTQCIIENGAILNQLRELRHEIASILGYPSHAAYKTEILMSKSAETVQKFLKDLAQKLKPLWVEEKKVLLQLKEKDCSELGLPFDGRLNSWDTAYYCAKMKEVKYLVDTEKLREYFPLPVVKQGLLNIYQELLGLKFEQLEGDIEVWYEDVEVYSVKDSSSGALLGYFYLDLFPRPNKYGHAAVFEMQHGHQREDGSRQITCCAMVANFTKATKDKPALLDHNEVTTFFHEFGHVMHYICTEVEYPLFFPHDMERDFIEAPSQMLENWCWEKEPLCKMSSHYLDKKPIPDEMLASLIKSRMAVVGLKNLRQIVLSLYDQRVHTNSDGDTRELYYQLNREIVGLESQEGTHFACHFGHIANEYDAQYYGYLWSEVYSMDMFQTRFAGGNIFSPKAGRDYRNKILARGGTKDAMELVTDFLGRPPSPEAFLHSKGLKS